MAASGPTSPLSQVQDKVCYTERVFRDLNFSLRCSGFETVPYAPAPIPDAYRPQVLSWKVFRSLAALRRRSVLYPADKRIETILRHISAGTSHRRIRLAFHPYSQVIQVHVCNAGSSFHSPFEELHSAHE